MARPPEGARRGRILLTAVLLVLGAGAAALTVGLSRRGIARLELTGARLDETGAFSSARIRLQRAALQQLPPFMATDNLLVEDIRIQLQQARNLGPRLPDDVLYAIDRLANVLGAPLVARDDLVAAAILLERIVDAETDAQARILTDAVSDIDRERSILLLGLLGTVAHQSGQDRGSGGEQYRSRQPWGGRPAAGGHQESCPRCQPQEELG